MAAISALLIDLDDTLFPESARNDSGLRAAALALAMQTGLHTEDVLGRLRYEQKAQGRDGAFARTCVWFDVDSGAAQAMAAAYADHAPALRLYPGAVEALEALRARYRIAVMAPGPMGDITARVLKLSEKTDAIVVCARESVAGADALALAAARLGVAPGQCLMVGDDPYLDGLAARALGAPFCRVLTGRFSDVEAGGEPEDIRIPAFADLPAALGV